MSDPPGREGVGQCGWGAECLVKTGKTQPLGLTLKESTSAPPPPQPGGAESAFSLVAPEEGTLALEGPGPPGSSPVVCSHTALSSFQGPVALVPLGREEDERTKEEEGEWLGRPQRPRCWHWASGHLCIFFPAGPHQHGVGLGSVGVRGSGTCKADLRKGPSTC